MELDTDPSICTAQSTVIHSALIAYVGFLGLDPLGPARCLVYSGGPWQYIAELGRSSRLVGFDGWKHMCIRSIPQKALGWRGSLQALIYNDIP